MGENEQNNINNRVCFKRCINMKKTIIWILVMVLIGVLSSISVMGAPCTAVPVEDCTVTGDLTLDFGTYTLNDTGSAGAIIFDYNLNN